MKSYFKKKLLLKVIGFLLPSLTVGIVIGIIMIIIQFLYMMVAIVTSSPTLELYDEFGNINPIYYEALIDVREDIYDQEGVIVPLEYIYATDSISRGGDYTDLDVMYVTWDELVYFYDEYDEELHLIQVEYDKIDDITSYSSELISAFNNLSYTEDQSYTWVIAYETFIKLNEFDTDNLLIYPLIDPFVISATFDGNDEVHNGEHKGIDFVSLSNWYVYASLGGIVTETYTDCDQNGYYGNECGGGRGNYITVMNILDSGDVYYTMYYHLLEVNVNIGDTVKQGQKIGVGGNSGSSTGRHVHFEIQNAYGEAFDPLPYFDTGIYGPIQ